MAMDHIQQALAILTELQGISRASSLSTQHQALPVHVRTRVGEAGAEAASLSEEQVNERVTESITQCLCAHGGPFGPSRISHKVMGLSRSDEPMCARLNKLLQLPDDRRQERHAQHQAEQS